MESGISNGWELQPDDEIEERKTELGNPHYFKHRDIIKENVRKWRENNREIYLEYERKRTQRRKLEGKPRKPRKLTKLQMRKKKQRYMRNVRARDKRPKIICLFGASGSGKTAASLYLKKKYDLPVICSYTTRPMREGEVDGVDHYFVKDVPPREEMLAYTVYGGYEYWALKSDAMFPMVVYVVDEAGINEMIKMDDIRIYPVHIIRTEIQRRKSGVSEERIARDRDRVAPEFNVRVAITNNRKKLHFYKKLRDMYEKIKKL